MVAKGAKAGHDHGRSGGGDAGHYHFCEEEFNKGVALLKKLVAESELVGRLRRALQSGAATHTTPGPTTVDGGGSGDGGGDEDGDCTSTLDFSRFVGLLVYWFVCCLEPVGTFTIAPTLAMCTSTLPLKLATGFVTCDWQLTMELALALAPALALALALALVLSACHFLFYSRTPPFSFFPLCPQYSFGAHREAPCRHSININIVIIIVINTGVGVGVGGSVVLDKGRTCGCGNSCPRSEAEEGVDGTRLEEGLADGGVWCVCVCVCVCVCALAKA